MAKRSILERAAERFDLPGDALAGLPRIEVIGFHEVRMENHKGILAYSSEVICISGGRSTVCITGSELTLRAMNSSELLITGNIRGVEFEAPRG